MLGDYNLLVLDEPTNNIDIASAEVLESALQTFQGTAIIVSHDRYLLDNAVDRILELPGDGTLREFLGNYTYYLDHRAQNLPPQLPSPRGKGAPEAIPRGKREPTPRGQGTSSTPLPRTGEELGVGADSGSPSPAHGGGGRGVGFRVIRFALLGASGAGKRTLLNELALAAGAQDGTTDAPPGTVPLGDGFCAAITIASAAPGAESALITAARQAEYLLLAQDLAAPSLEQLPALLAVLGAAGIRPVPQPLPIRIRARAKGGLAISGGEPGQRDELLRWCRARQIAHAEVTILAAVALADLATYAEAAWRRSGAAKAQRAASGPDAALAFRPALIVGTRYDELTGDAAAAEEQLRAAMLGFASVAVSALDAESIARLRAALVALTGG
jgi:hypothetical protein